jgi:hypothetical protein
MFSYSFCEFSSEGSLDMLYLESRFQRGKTWTDKYMDAHHRYLVNDAVGLADAHAAQIGFQSDNQHPGDSFLGSFSNHIVIAVDQRCCCDLVVSLLLVQVAVDGHGRVALAFPSSGSNKAFLNLTALLLCGHFSL